MGNWDWGLETGDWGLGTGDWGMGGSCYCHALDLWTVPRLQDAVT